jgi:hypothetical protein
MKYDATAKSSAIQDYREIYLQRREAVTLTVKS